jgi:hypothetical protein
MEEALPLFGIYWFLWLNCCGRDSSSRVCVNDLLFSIFSGSDSKSRFSSLSLTSTTNDCFEQHSSVLCQGLLWKLHHFPVSFFVFPLPFFSCVLDWLLEGCWLGPSLPCFGCCRFANPNSHLFWCLHFYSILTTYR